MKRQRCCRCRRW